MLAVLVSTAGVSMFSLLWFVGLSGQPQRSGQLMVSQPTLSSVTSARPRFVPATSVAADLETSVSSEAGSSSVNNDSVRTEEEKDTTTDKPLAITKKKMAASEATVTKTLAENTRPTETKSVSFTKRTDTTAEDDTKPNSFELAVAKKIHQLTNETRLEQGLSALRYDPALAGPSFNYSLAMQTENFFSHTDPSGCGMTCRFAKTKYKASAWGENLALWQSSYAPGVDEVAEYFVREWKKSAGHRENLLSAIYTNEGIGVSVKGNKILVTVHFAKP